MSVNSATPAKARKSYSLRSPEDLDSYIKVTNPAVWAVLFVSVALLVALLIWGIFGTVSTSVMTTGVKTSGGVLCFLDQEDASKVKVGNTAIISGAEVTVTEISDTPQSKSEVSTLLASDYLVEALANRDWSYMVRFSDDGSIGEYVPLEVEITTDRIAPITLVAGTRGSE